MNNWFKKKKEAAVRGEKRGREKKISKYEEKYNSS